jgi:uncharacterized protein YdbL (DUF1318 family)
MQSPQEVIPMRRVLPIKLALVFLLAACVTVNVYFPAAAAQDAADKIIDTVTKPADGAQPQDTQAVPPTSRAVPADDTPILLVALGRALEMMIPAAQAQANANLDISSPEIRAVTGSMQKRFGQLEKYFTSGAVGLTADGLIELRDQNAVPLAERATAKRLVSEDNNDRQTLYAQIAKANGHPEWEGDIRKTFARRWVERGAKPGWYYQDGGSWKQK